MCTAADYICAAFCGGEYREIVVSIPMAVQCIKRGQIPFFKVYFYVLVIISDI